MNTTATAPAAPSPYVRVCVPKPTRAGKLAKGDYTTAYIRRQDYVVLLRLAGGEVKTVTNALRFAAVRLSPREGIRWSQLVVAGAIRLLQKALDEAEALQRKVAAENNSAWDNA